MDLLDAAEHWARVAPERVAHESGGRTLTYGDLGAQVEAVAASLAAELPDDGSPIIVRGHKEPEMLVGFLGALGAGHPYVPIDTILPEARVDAIIRVARPPLVLAPSDIARRASFRGPAPRRERRPDDVHYIMFTSGSTGEPKGVPITRDNLARFLSWMTREHPFQVGAERFLNQVIYSFDLSLMDTGVSLVTGGTVVSVTHEDAADPGRLFRALAQSGITTWVSTPTFAQICLVERRFDATMLPAVRRFLFCGETLPPETAAALLDRFPAAEVWNTYGPTETTVAVTGVRVDRDLLARYPVLPIGRPGPGMKVLVVNGSQAPVADGQPGEIVIVGPQVSPGYLHRPELSQRVFVDVDGQRGYRTGDLGHYRDGLLFFDGRRDAQIKLHGHRIELGDVEANLAALPGVLGAAVVPVVTEGHTRYLAAFVVLREGAAAPAEVSRSLKDQLRERLPAYMVPRRIRALDAFPMTPNGKVDRPRLAELAP